jgi:type IV secretory pathway TraG/TraD family ATPase VirD4
VKKLQHSYSGSGLFLINRSESEQEYARPLLSPAEVSQLSEDDGILLVGACCRTMPQDPPDARKRAARMTAEDRYRQSSSDRPEAMRSLVTVMRPSRTRAPVLRAGGGVRQTAARRRAARHPTREPVR